MNIKRVLTIACIITLATLSGCATVRDYDPEKAEAEQVRKIHNAQSRDPFANSATHEHVKIAEKDGIRVDVHKAMPLISREGIRLDVWRVSVRNKSSEDSCVTIRWALQDFEWETTQPDEFLVLSGESFILGKMTQTVWAFDGDMIALPPSGYVKDMNVRKADIDKKTGKMSCPMDESGIDEV